MDTIFVDVAATGGLLALTAAGLVLDQRRQGDDQRVLVFAGIGALAVVLDSLEPFGASSDVLPTSLLLVVSVVAFALAAYNAGRRLWNMLGGETPNGS